MKLPLKFLLWRARDRVKHGRCPLCVTRCPGCAVCFGASLHGPCAKALGDAWLARYRDRLTRR